ncbi:hypothetical protein MNBD_UNCLBAC01-260 [hydrothermal vent metagenome]|uniref:PIN domain-containing protein n=1 Tax=hydrothermal vent metagenome TaxID=652676 RepID=A0A3B1DDR7_9ZZZZ
MKKTKVVLDSFAVISYFQQEAGSDKVVRLLTRAEKNKCTLLLNLVNWGEIYYSITRTKGEKVAQEILLIIEQLPIILADIDRDLVFLASRFKSRYAVSYADCFAAALAQREQCAVITGDKEFKLLEKDIDVIWMK